MTTVILPRDVSNAIVDIAYQLERANELRAEELELMKLYMEKKVGVI